MARRSTKLPNFVLVSEALKSVDNKPQPQGVCSINWAVDGNRLFFHLVGEVDGGEELWIYETDGSLDIDGSTLQRRRQIIVGVALQSGSMVTELLAAQNGEDVYSGTAKTHHVDGQDSTAEFFDLGLSSEADTLLELGEAAQAVSQ